MAKYAQSQFSKLKELSCVLYPCVLIGKGGNCKNRLGGKSLNMSSKLTKVRAENRSERSYNKRGCCRFLHERISAENELLDERGSMRTKYVYGSSNVSDVGHICRSDGSRLRVAVSNEHNNRGTTTANHRRKCCEIFTRGISQTESTGGLQNEHINGKHGPGAVEPREAESDFVGQPQRTRGIPVSESIFVHQEVFFDERTSRYVLDSTIVREIHTSGHHTLLRIQFVDS